MIRYDTGTTYNGEVGRASAFSEHDGLNPSVLTAYAMPLAYGDYSIEYESGYGVQDGVPVYGTFDNSSDSIRQIGRLSGDVVLKFMFQCRTVLDAVLVDMAGTQEPAFDATLRGLASDGVSMVEIGTVRAGFPEECQTPSLNVFGSYGESRSWYGRAGKAMLRFHNESFESDHYVLTVSPVSSSQNVMYARKILAYASGSLDSPVVSFPLTADGVDSRYGETTSLYGVGFSDGSATFSLAGSRILFPRSFMFGAERATISLWLRIPDGVDGVVVACGEWGLSASTVDGDRNLSMDGRSVACGSLSDWRRATVEFTGFRHVLRLDGNEVMSVPSMYSPFLRSASDVLMLGDGVASPVGMSVRMLCLYDHPIGKDGVDREMARLK